MDCQQLQTATDGSRIACGQGERKALGVPTLNCMRYANKNLKNQDEFEGKGYGV